MTRTKIQTGMKPEVWPRHIQGSCGEGLAVHSPASVVALSGVALEGRRGSESADLWTCCSYFTQNNSEFLCWTHQASRWDFI